ncbi:MAG TPA: RnfH family protein [Aestuariivirgaceae bacterium]|nr:RnfH family protein [Aestuariivirgaceae bacterium]
MRAEVAYALPEEQIVIELQLPEGATVGEAIRASGMLARFPEIELTRIAVGIFGERAVLDDPLQEGDRVEIYRPLLADPKETRRRRARRRARP